MPRLKLNHCKKCKGKGHEHHCECHKPQRKVRLNEQGVYEVKRKF